MNCLILFSGTKSFSNNLTEHNVRTLDIEKKFEPYYCTDILKWNYQEELKDFKVDYLHASPVCCHFSSLNNGFDLNSLIKIKFPIISTCV